MVKNIRSKGEKTDEELLEYYKDLEKKLLMYTTGMWIGTLKEYEEKIACISKHIREIKDELGGKERVEFLLFKMGTEERLKNLEACVHKNDENVSGVWIAPRPEKNFLQKIFSFFF